MPNTAHTVARHASLVAACNRIITLLRHRSRDGVPSPDRDPSIPDECFSLAGPLDESHPGSSYATPVIAHLGSIVRPEGLDSNET